MIIDDTNRNLVANNIYLSQRVGSLTARIKRLEEALGPLVQELERCEGYKAPEHIPDEWVMAFRVGDLRRARAAYNGEPDAQGSK